VVDVGMCWWVVSTAIIWLTSIIVTIMCGDAVVGLPRVGRSVFCDELSKVASSYQFFNLVLKRFTLICGVAIVPIILAVFGHVGVGWV